MPDILLNRTRRTGRSSRQQIDAFDDRQIDDPFDDGYPDDAGLDAYRQALGRKSPRRRRVAADVEEPKRFRPFVRRWMTALMLMVAGLLAVLYVSNAIAVNQLLADNISLERERDAVQNENERLRAELLRLQSVERVTGVASEHLGMVQPKRPPVALDPEVR